MKLKEVVSELVVEDVKRSIDFYKEMLGFEVTAQVPETGSPGWAELVNGSARLMIQSREETQAEIPSLSTASNGGTMLLVFRFEDHDMVRDLWTKSAKLKRVVFPLRETDYGTIEFSVTDPDGYILIFAGK